eukprot:Amastigsp_a427_14.p4 type:complete len:160 gc:universal Amastigsp_a427_14:482-961(+)
MRTSHGVVAASLTIQRPTRARGIAHADGCEANRAARAQSSMPKMSPQISSLSLSLSGYAPRGQSKTNMQSTSRRWRLETMAIGFFERAGARSRSATLCISGRASMARATVSKLAPSAKPKGVRRFLLSAATLIDIPPTRLSARSRIQRAVVELPASSAA